MNNILSNEEFANLTSGKAVVPPKLLTVARAAKKAKLDVNTVYGYIKSGRLKAVPARGMLVDLDELNRIKRLRGRQRKNQ